MYHVLCVSVCGLKSPFPIIMQIDCSSNDCHLRTINGSSATSLTVDCGGSGCAGSIVICPVGDNSHCAVDCSNNSYLCQYATIHNVAGGDMSSFTLLCSADYACQYMTVDLDPDSISVVDIVCSAPVCVFLISSVLK